VNRRIAAIAASQHGLVTREQALAAGVSPQAIQRRLAEGSWQRVHSGVYAIAGSRKSPEQMIRAACLAAGPDAAASHGTAAGLHLLPAGNSQIHISIPATRKVKLEAVTIHRPATLDRVDRVVKKGIPVTSVARTLIDLSATLRLLRLEEVLDHALANRIVSLQMLRHRLKALGTQGRGGTAGLEGLIAARLEGSPRARQRGERLFMRIVQQYGLPTPEREVEYHLSDGRTVYVDFVFCEVVGAEIDSYLHHSSLTDWAADRGRNNLLRAQGLTLLNVTEPQMRSDAAGVAAQFQEALISRGVL
jgi:hypothetical protein